MSESLLLTNNKIESILSMGKAIAPAQEESNDGNFLLNPEDLKGVTEDNPIQRNAEIETLQRSSVLESAPQQKIESILNFHPDLDLPEDELDVDKQDPSFLDKLGYFFGSSENDVTNAAIWAEAKWPLGQFIIDENGFNYLSPDEAYGEGFSDADEVTRGEMIKAFKARRLAEDYPEFAYAEPDAPVAEFLGTAGKILFSPSTLAPIGQTKKAMAGIGALLGFEYGVFEQLSDRREIYDPASLAITTGVGAATSLGIGVGMNKLAQSIKKSTAAKQNKAMVKQANHEAEIIYNEVVKIQALDDVPPQQLPQVVADRIGSTPQEVAETLRIASRNIVVPTRAEAKLILESTDANVLGKGLLSNNLGILSSEIARFSRPLAQKIVMTEGRIRRKTFKAANKIHPYMTAINKQLPKKLRSQFNIELFSGRISEAKKILDENTEIGGAAVDRITDTLDQIYGELRKAGIKLPYLEGYIPRNLRDRNGLRAYYGLKSAEVSEIDKRLASLAKRLGKKVVDLTAEEESLVYNTNLIKNFVMTGRGKAGFTKARSIDEITEDTLPFYDDFESSIYGYINNAYRTIETSNLFGKQAIKKADGYLYDIDESIGEMLAREVTKRSISKEDLPEIKRLVRLAVDTPKTPNQVFDIVQSIGYGQTITNYLSTLMQFGDVPHHIRRNGLFPTFEALLNPLNRKDIKAEEILGNVISAEMGTTKGVAKGFRRFVEKLLDSPLSGFSQLDKFMKTGYLKGALASASKKIKTEKGFQQLREDYAEAFGDDFAALVQDLRAEKLSDNVLDYLFLDASDLYPTSHLEQISAVANQPNWRILTMLKSYTLKSIYDGTVRRDIIGNAKKGRHKEAAKNLLYLTMFLGMSEATLMEAKDFMLGRGFNAGDIPNNFGDGALRVLGFSRYVVDRYLARGDIEGAILETVSPPAIILNDAFKDGKSALNKELTLENSRTIGSLPIIGRFYTNYLRRDANGETQREREIKTQEQERLERSLEKRRKQVLGERKYSY
jgi:hypothetical protein